MRVNEILKISVGKVCIIDGHNEPVFIDCNKADAVDKLKKTVYNDKEVLYLAMNGKDKNTIKVKYDK